MCGETNKGVTNKSGVFVLAAKKKKKIISRQRISCEANKTKTTEECIFFSLIFIFFAAHRRPCGAREHLWSPTVANKSTVYLICVRLIGSLLYRFFTLSSCRMSSVCLAAPNALPSWLNSIWVSALLYTLLHRNHSSNKINWKKKNEEKRN